RVDAGYEAFRELASVPGLGARAESRLCAVAPRALREAGRADLAAEFMRADGPVPLETRSMSGEWNLPPTAEPRLECRVHSSDGRTAGRVQLERIRTLAALGRRRRARRALESVAPSSEGRRSAWVLRATLERELEGSSDSVGGAGWARRLVEAHRAGRHRRVVSLVERLDDPASAGPEGVRFALQAFAALDRPGAARDLLARTGWRRSRPALYTRLRLLVDVRSGADVEDLETVSTLADVSAANVDYAADVGEVLAWSGRLDRAIDWLERALDRQPSHSRANWLRGLVAELKNGSDGSKFLGRSRRFQSQQGGVALWTARYHLLSDRPERARDAFYRAIVARPERLAAVRGFGRASVASEAGARSRRVLARLVEHHGGGAEPDSAVANEALRWIAVLRGSRRGVEGADGPLQRARPTPGVLVERARFARATDRRDRARSLLERALEKDSTYAAARLELAELELRAGGAAREQLERYLDLAPHGARADWVREQLDAEASDSSTDSD
ncbi:MAG: hypothetical protein ABEL76_15640, partial [Bradymonadaceae bacterium]